MTADILAPPPPDQPEFSPAEGAQRILVIDDDPFVVRMVRAFLADYGFVILEAATGAEGLELARRERPELILLDIHMPGEDGFEVCARLKGGEAADAAVIFFTSRNAVEEKVRAFALGAVDFIAKPVEQPELLARIAVHLGQRRLHHHLLRRLGAYRDLFGPLPPAPEAPPATQAGEGAGEPEELPERRLRKVQLAREILEREVARPPSFDDLARRVGINGKRLSKDFQILFGMTAYQWLREHRLQRAAELLRATGMQVTEIAEQLGFSSGANLATMFRERFHLTPRQYRQTPAG